MRLCCQMTSRMNLWGRALAAHPPSRPKTLPVAQKAKQAPPEPPPEPTPPSPSTKADATSVYHTPDAWQRKFGDVKPTKIEESPNPPGRPRMRVDQRRRNTISIALSEEEEHAVRMAAAEKGISISEWARIAFFKYMGKKVPARDMSRKDWSKGPETTED